MKKIPLQNLDVTVFYEKLENGLELYMIPKATGKGIFATFSTNYGSKTTEFVPLGEKKMKQVHLGIAHFLEHQMFEQEDGIDPMHYFEERGASSNANTSKNKTTYLFSGPDHLKENLNHLLNFVQDPALTDESVEKEKGIIIQEIEMYQDNPYVRLREGSIYNSFIKDPIRYPILGTKKSVKAMGKEELYQCFQTFYHPSNMFLVLTGNIEPLEVLEWVKENQGNKEFAESSVIKTKTYTEPDQCEKDFEKIEMDVVLPKISINYKMNLHRMKDDELRKFLNYMDIYFNIKFGTTSLFQERMQKEGILTEEISVLTERTDTHILYMFAAETKYPDVLIEAVEKELADAVVDKEEFERKKRVYFSSYVYMSDNINSLNYKIMGNVNTFGYVVSNDCEEIRKLTVLELQKYLKHANFRNRSIYIVDKKAK